MELNRTIPTEIIQLLSAAEAAEYRLIPCGLLQHLYGRVVDGASLWEAMEGCGAFRPLDCGVVHIGEQTGRLAESLDFLRNYYRKRAEQTNRLPEMLLNQGDALVQEVEHRIRRLGGLLEPALILLVGILVAVILISMYMPMFRLGGMMG